MVLTDNRVDCHADPRGALARGIQWLRQGGIVGVPTESVYGLAVCADNGAAVARLRALKGREGHKPLPLVAQDGATVGRLFQPPPLALAALTAQLWPGPLTVGLQPRTLWPEGIAGADSAVGVRVSAHPVLRALCAGVDGLITATSANFAGEAPVQDLRAAPAELLAQVLWLDGGPLPGGLPSTVVLPRPNGRLHIARPGAVSLAQLQAVVGADVWI